MSQRQLPDAISTGLRYGWLFGFIMLGIYILYIVMDRVSGFPTRFLLLQGATSTVITYGIPGALLLIVAPVFLIGGILASAKTGRASSGWVAGQFGGLIYGIGSFLVFGTVYFVFVLPTLGLSALDPTLYWLDVVRVLSNQLVTIVLIGGVFMANLAGIIGGLIGRGRGRRRLSFSGA